MLIHVDAIATGRVRRRSRIGWCSLLKTVEGCESSIRVLSSISASPHRPMIGEGEWGTRRFSADAGMAFETPHGEGFPAAIICRAQVSRHQLLILSARRLVR